MRCIHRLFVITFFFLCLPACTVHESTEERVRACDPSLATDEAALHYRDEHQHTLLMMASEVGCNALVQKLVKQIDVNAKTTLGTTALTSSVFGNIEVMRILIDSGIDVHIKDNMGHTALISAVEMNKLEMTELLLMSGIDPNEQDSKAGITPLHMAVLAQRYPLVKLLLQYGGNPRIKAQRLGSALDIAKKKQDEQMLELLTEESIRGIKGTLPNGANLRLFMLYFQRFSSPLFHTTG